MNEATMIGVDLAKNVFQLHGAAADGSVVHRKKLSRLQFARFITGHRSRTVAIEAYRRKNSGSTTSKAEPGKGSIATP